MLGLYIVSACKICFDLAYMINKIDLNRKQRVSFGVQLISLIESILAACEKVAVEKCVLVTIKYFFESQSIQRSCSRRSE
jgi:hypothetical protein